MTEAFEQHAAHSDEAYRVQPLNGLLVGSQNPVSFINCDTGVAESDVVPNRPQGDPGPRFQRGPGSADRSTISRCLVAVVTIDRVLQDLRVDAQTAGETRER